MKVICRNNVKIIFDVNIISYNDINDHEYCIVNYKSGTKKYIKNGLFHKENGPAIIWFNGDKCYYRNGNLHRDNGPAVIHSDGNKEYWIDGILLGK